MKLIKFFIKYWLVGLLLIMTSAEAFQLDAIKMPVDDYSSQSLNQVLPEAMGQALVKLSGSAAVLDIPSIRQALSQSQNYMQSYNYHQEYQNGEPQLWVSIIFDRNSLEKLLQQTDQSLWAPRVLPQTLIWIKAEPNLTGNITTSSAVKKALVSQAKQLGLSVLFPEMDLEDDTIVGADQHQLFDNQTMQQIMRRYGVDAVLVGSFQPGGSQSWVSQWKLLWHGQYFTFGSQGNEKSVLASKALGQIMNYYGQTTNAETPPPLSHMNAALNPSIDEASPHAPSTNEVSDSDNKNPYGFLVMIVGVSNLNDYTRVMNYLRHIPIVTNVNVSHMGKNDLLLQVEAIGGASALKAVLTTSSRLHFMSSEDNKALYYQWRKLAKKTHNQPTSSMQFIDDAS